MPIFSQQIRAIELFVVQVHRPICIPLINNFSWLFHINNISSLVHDLLVHTDVSFVVFIFKLIISQF